jgi:hypothetical protein
LSTINAALLINEREGNLNFLEGDHALAPTTLVACRSHEQSGVLIVDLTFFLLTTTSIKSNQNPPSLPSYLPRKECNRMNGIEKINQINMCWEEEVKRKNHKNNKMTTVS